MDRGRTRRLAGWLLMVMLLALVPAVASAGGKWERVGQKQWLTEGIDLSTGGSGTDLIFAGDTITSANGMQILSDSDYIDYDLVAPQTGYVKALSTTSAAYNRILVRLADGGYAQVRLGMASASGFIYTGIFLQEWVVQKGSGKIEPLVRGEIKLKLNSPEAVGNGVPATLDAPPQLVGGQVMLPLRYLGETLGLQMFWDAREQKVRITGEDLEITLWVGQKSAQINGQTVALSQAPTIIKNRLMIPMLVVGENLAGKASYDAATGAITLGGPAPVAAPVGQTAKGEWPAHFSATWLSGYENGWISDSAKARPDFYLTLNEDGTARVIQTITGFSYGFTLAINLEYLGTYTLEPFRVELTLQPPIKGYETLEHEMPYWQKMTVTGTLSADLGTIGDLRINGTGAKSGAAVRAKRVPEPGEWR